MKSRSTLALSLLTATILAAAACSRSSGSGTPANTFQWVDPGFTEPAGSQNYQCFFVDVPMGTSVGAIEFSYEPSIILHHMVIFTTESTANSGASGTTADCTDNPFNTDWIIRYAGGTHTGPLTLPKGVAMPMDTGVEHFIIQLHLLNASTSATKDDTKVTITFTPPNTTFTDAGLVLSGATQFTIPVAGTGTSSLYSIVSHCDIPTGTPAVNLFAVWPHMHKIGYSFNILDTPATGSPFTMLDVNWDFNNQPMWVPTNSLTAGGGDTLTTTCTWDNTTGAPVNFGELSSDEMCFDFFYYYPADPAQGLETVCSDQINGI